MKPLHATRITMLAGGLALASLTLPGQAGQPGEGAAQGQQEQGERTQRERAMPRQQDRRERTERQEQMRGRSGMGGGMGPGMMDDDEGSMTQAMEELRLSLEQLDLTDDQRRTLRELRQEHRQQQFERMATMMNLREDMQDAMAGELPDPDEVRSVHGNMAEVHGEMLAEHVRFQNELRETLTDEQREQLESLREGQDQ